MMHFRRISAGLAVAVALTASTSLPASASDTNLTVTVLPGALSISAPDAVEFNDIRPGKVSEKVIKGILVKDYRAGTLGWSASVSISDFTRQGASSETIPASQVTYTPGTPVTAGRVTVATSSTIVAGVDSVVQSGSNVVGSNTAEWDSVIALTAPDKAAPGVYSGAIVHSVL